MSNFALSNFEDIYTFLLQIETGLNSRFLTALSSDPAGLNTLTPAYGSWVFLVGDPVHQFPQLSQPAEAPCFNERKRFIQKFCQQFWDIGSKSICINLNFVENGGN